MASLQDIAPAAARTGRIPQKPGTDTVVHPRYRSLEVLDTLARTADNRVAADKAAGMVDRFAGIESSSLSDLSLH